MPLNRDEVKVLVEKQTEFLRNTRFSKKLAEHILTQFDDTNSFRTIENILNNYDYRNIADFFRLQQKGIHTSLVDKIATSEYDSGVSRRMDNTRLNAESERKQRVICDYSYKNDITELNNPTENGEINIFLHTNDMKHWFDTFLDENIETISEGFLNLLDHRGINSLVRPGLIKTLTHTDGSALIIKQQNPNKPKKLLDEQIAIAGLRERTNLDRDGVTIRSGDTYFELKMVVYIGLIQHQKTGKLHSISQRSAGMTLEAWLLLPHKESERHRVLLDVRAILDWLYEQGIYWGDMAPRNVLINDGFTKRTYTILDFEKTFLTDKPTSFWLRTQHARGPTCVEEFGAVCTREEVEACFCGYFEPSEWPTSSEDPVTLTHPKGEFLDIIMDNGCETPTQGQYNELELSIMNIRFPFYSNYEKLTFHPLFIGFRADHYFGPEADKKITQILLYALSINCFQKCVKLLNGLLDEIDCVALFDEFLALELGDYPRVRNSIIRSSSCFTTAIEQMHKCIGLDKEFLSVVHSTSELDL